MKDRISETFLRTLNDFSPTGTSHGLSLFWCGGTTDPEQIVGSLAEQVIEKVHGKQSVSDERCNNQQLCPRCFLNFLPSHHKLHPGSIALFLYRTTVEKTSQANSEGGFKK